ncbi:hypothetical protein GQ53DRAFT_822666 [Thozetella sp. PMI_491]|nr:hypothetical protein GQ53DRAFT_822666 [Thozetella sp. PMI_491]
MGTVTEAAREREAFRYGHSLLDRSVIHNGSEPPNPYLVKATTDTALAAFAQLGALRLQATRALISLFDHKHQHIIAEATCSSRINGTKEGQDGDKSTLSLSGMAIPRGSGICERVLVEEAPPRQPDTPTDRPQLSELRVSTVLDLRKESRLNDSPYPGTNDPDLRFYAGVPIRSRRGINIGVYSVFGSEARHALDSESISFLQDMSETIMRYLEMVAAATGHQRNVRMVRGLGSLVEGKGSMSEWWLGDNSASFADAAGGEGALNTRQQNIQRDEERSHLAPNPPPTLASRHSTIPSPEVDIALDNAEPVAQQPTMSANSGSSKTVGRATNSGAGAGSVFSAPSKNSSGSVAGTTSGSVTNPPEDESIVAMRALLSRGANIVRESIECEGVLFLDAAIGSYGGMIGQSDPESTGSSESRESPTSSNEEGRKKDLAGDKSDVLCKILGYSTSEFSSIDGDPASLAHLSVPEKFLRRLLRMYPDGRVFNFDAQGAAESEGESSEDFAIMLPRDAAEEGHVLASKSRQKRPLKPSDSHVLTDTFAGARSIAFIPLWDSQRDRWFAGGFVWTRTPTRVFTTKGELSYLKAFGMTVMAEVARIHALRSTKAKADVLGSVSHELRSPLHGIILGLELLRDTTLDTFQEDVLHTLETCGRTLVDTINHLLDFSKINRFVRMSRHRGSGRTRGVPQAGTTLVETGMTNLYSDVSLDVLVEEVVESVYAGFSYQQISGSLVRNFAPNTPEISRTDTLRRFGSIGPMDNPDDVPLLLRTTSTPVAVYLNIDPSFRWMFYAQPGAIRRVIMNLFGNALKYTTRGFIIVSLTQDPVPENRKNGRRTVTLSIYDSGKGISEDYLKNQLFTPFAQEDHLASGVGLGLSLVKQITNTLGGKITMESQVRRGTIVRVSLPLRRSRKEAQETRTPLEADFAENVEVLKGQAVSVIGFSQDNSADNPLASSMSQSGPRATIEGICRDWLKMEVISEEEHTLPTFYICTEDTMDQVSLPADTAPGHVAHVVVVCHNASAAHELARTRATSTAAQIYEFISQPAGPRKLAKILATTLKRRGQSPRPSQDHADPSPRPSVQTLAPRTQETHPPSEAPLNGTHAQSPPHEKTEAFLLVDDNLINLKVLSSYMKKLGRFYDTGENGLEAVDAYRQNPDKYSCILMDISMPIMDGLEATRLIREFEQKNKLEPTLIIALTGLASSSTQDDALASGIDIFLTKPVPFAELRRIIEAKNL